MEHNLEVVNVATDDLIPYVNNARTHSDEQVTQIAASIKEFGFNNPILVDGSKGVIAGHARLLAAKKLGLKTVPVIELGHLSEVQKKAYILADNKIALNAGWDDELLTLEMDWLKSEAFCLSLTGFDAKELSSFKLTETPQRTLDEEKYTAKINTPVYEITGELPLVSDLFDTAKMVELREAILAAEIPDDTKEFLLHAAYRHIKFNYAKIAEFYAHQPKEIQDLMEQSALVIIDYDKAVENGYVWLTEELKKLSQESGNESY